MRALSSAPVLVLLCSACTPDPGGINIHNADPRAEITSHAEGDAPDAGVRTFTGTVEDPDHAADELELTWMVDGAEACPPITPDASGNTSCEIFLESGDRTVTLQVEDPLGGLGSDKVTLDVQAYGDPWAEIAAPIAGDVYYSDQLIDFLGQVGDEADGPSDLEAWWESGGELLEVLAEPDASGNVIGSGYLDEGDHQLILKVRNSGGNEAYDAVTITVGAPNTAPSCGITFPGNGASYPFGDPVAFTAEVSDPDVPADWLEVSWESDHDGELGDSSPDTSGEVTFATSGLTVNTHTITLRVADEQGATCSDNIQLTVEDCSDQWFADADGDGFGDPASSTTGCEQPSGYVTDDQDCDDGDAAVNPDADEVCNGLDDDCDGDIDDADASLDTSTASTWYADGDGDGYGDATAGAIACDQPSGYQADASDCDDADAAVNPAATEVCNGVDDDCDGDADDADASLDTSTASTWYSDADGDGYGDASTSSLFCDQPSGTVADDTDCNDSSATIHPGADEYCDGIDTDCDGTLDEQDALDATTWYADADGDGYGDPLTSDHGCAAATGYVADDADCDDGSATTHPGADEYCDGIDTDCDGTLDEQDALDATTWYADVDGDGYGDPLSTDHACTAGSGFVSDNTDCDDSAWAVNPAATEVCGGIDEDCDGLVDDADADLDTSTATTWYADDDSDGYGDVASSALACDVPSGFGLDASDCDDADAAINPSVAEVCNEVDDDCDGDIDDDDSSLDTSTASTWYADGDGDGYGDSGDSSLACDQPSGTVADDSDCDDGDSSISPLGLEICSGVDEDCDGLVDDDDPSVDSGTWSVWYADGDSDGYGDSSTVTWACDAPSGYVSDGEDCDDGDAAVSPGASEIYDVSDWTDEDCDGWAGVLYDDFDSGHSDGDVVASGSWECTETSVTTSIDTEAWEGCGNGNASTYSSDYAYSGSFSLATEMGSGEVGQVLSAFGTDFRMSFAFMGTESPSHGNQLFSLSDHTDGDGVIFGYAAGGACGSSFGIASYDAWDGSNFSQCLGTRTEDSWSTVELEASYSSTTEGEVELCIDGVCTSTPESYSVSLAAFFTNDDFIGGYFDDIDIEVRTGDDLDGDGWYEWVDCDDSDASVYPGAVEICDDGIDQDCDGMALGCGVSGTVDLGTADAYILGESTNSAVGYSLACGDINGDGLDDVLLGAYSEDEGGNDAGAAYVVSGGVSGNFHLSFAEAKLVGEADENYAGRSVAVDDLNADGFADIIVGAMGSAGSSVYGGAVYLVFGPATGTIDLSAANAKYFAEAVGDQVGESVAAGDVDGDGYGDVLVGAPARTGYAGAAYLMSGAATGTVELGLADANFIAADHSDFAGSSVGLGDVNGDGLDDVLIGASSAGGVAHNSGALFLVLGPVSGTIDLSSYDAKYGGETYDAHLGKSVATGDLDGDGTEDILVGAYGAGGSASTGVGEGAAYVLLGPHTGSHTTSVADASVVGEDDFDMTGYSVCIADIDGDSAHDVLIGAHGEDSGGPDAGAAFLFYGPTTGSHVLSSADASLVGENSVDEAGVSVASGDIDGSGVADIVVGAYGVDSFTGAAYVVLGGGM